MVRHMRIKENEKISPYTTLKIGGAARFFCEAKDEKEILEAMEFACEKNMPVFVLGGGSNILVSDKGFDGLVIKIINTECQILDTKIECGAGCQLSAIVGESVKSGLKGLEWAAGIPGTVGGAIRGNAGAFGGEMADCIESVKVIDIQNFSKARLFPSDKQAVGIPKSQAIIMNYELGKCEFGYRDSVFKQNPNLIIILATLALKKGKKEEIEKKVKEIIKQRKEVQPFDFPSSGSFFKNPIVKNENLIQEFKKDTGQKAKDGIIPAGYLIDQADLRGKKIGGAMVSQNHGNFLVNTGNAKAEDFMILIALVKTRVRNKFGIQLKEEVQYVGF
jgi:UDP-N-acetylmuramate dehydrogenase